MADDDEILAKRRKELVGRLLHDNPVSLNNVDMVETCITDDNLRPIPIPCYVELRDKVGIVLYRSKEVFESDLEELIIPHIKLLVDNEEISFLEIESKLDYKLRRVCDYLCAIIHVASYLFVSSHGWNSWQVGEPRNDELLTVSRVLLGSNVLGEKIKLIIGAETIQTRDIGKYLVEGKTSLHICKKAKINYCGEYNAPLEVLIHIEQFMDRILNKNIIIPVAFDFEGWGVGYL